MRLSALSLARSVPPLKFQVPAPPADSIKAATIVPPALRLTVPLAVKALSTRNPPPQFPCRSRSLCRPVPRAHDQPRAYALLAKCAAAYIRFTHPEENAPRMDFA